MEVKLKFPAPKPWGVCYAGPSPGGQRKRCGTCMMFVLEGSCAIHPRRTTVTPDHICGYHVHGQPMKKWMDHPGIQPLKVTESGLELVKGGTSCDVCRYYAVGVCLVVAGASGKPPAKVHPRGCCARWEKKTE